MKKIALVFFLVLISNTAFGELRKISLGIGQCTLAMDNFNDYTQNGLINSQMNFEKIKTGKSINVEIVSDIKHFKNIDLALSIGYLSSKSIGSADSLFYWENNWQPGHKTTYHLYAIPMLLSVVYNLEINSGILNNFNADVGGGLGFYTAVTSQKLETINQEEEFYKKSYSDSKLGFHFYTTISYNIFNKLFIGSKVIYKVVDNHNMVNSFKLDYTGLGVNLILGINFE